MTVSVSNTKCLCCQVLDFSHNNITHIGRGYLRPIESSLTHLYLSYNSLQNATRDVFGNIQHMQWLDLSANRLNEIDFDTFRNSRKLQVSINRSKIAANEINCFLIDYDFISF